MSLILAYQNRGLAKDFTIDDGDGDAITPGANDKIRISIGRINETPKLTFDSDTATANGSSITINEASNRLRLDASDLVDIDPGIYTLFVDYFDNADASEWKNVSRQVFVLEGT